MGRDSLGALVRTHQAEVYTYIHVYKVTKDGNGRKTGAEADGKKAEIKGNVEDQDRVKWITVLGAKLVE